MGNCQKEEGEEDNLNHLNGPVNEIRISNFIWNKDYQGLFDYDSKAIDKKVIKIKGDAIVIKNGSKFELADDSIGDLSQIQLKNSIFRIVSKPNFYQVHPIYIEGETYTLQKILWLVIASLPNKLHCLQERDILKLGKQKVRIREIVYTDSGNFPDASEVKLSRNVYENLTNKNTVPKSQIMLQQQKQQKQVQSVVTSSQQVCRICLENGEFDNPLITPCKCSGSVKYIHLGCLKSWLGKRLNAIKSKHCITINWQPLSCEMCMAPFKYRIYMDGKKFYTVDIPKPPKPFIIIQLMKKQTSGKGKIFHFVSFAEKKKITLGRKKDIDVRVSDDISISRVHATIQFNQETKRFSISDNKSKFGTLVLVKKGVISYPKYPGISVQIGAQVFSFDALRGQERENFEPMEGNPDNYLVEDSLNEDDENENSQESEAAQSDEGSQIQQQEIDESGSPNIHNQSSVPEEAN